MPANDGFLQALILYLSQALSQAFCVINIMFNLWTVGCEGVRKCFEKLLTEMGRLEVCQYSINHLNLQH